METLKCTMVDHEAENKSIDGICMTEGCQAPMRIMCAICSKKYHGSCIRKEFLTEEEIKGKLTEIKLMIIAHQNNLNLNRLSAIKNSFLKLFDQLESKFQAYNQEFYQVKVERIEAIQEAVVFTKDIWLESYALIKQDHQQDFRMQCQDQIFSHLDVIDASIRSLNNINDHLKSQRNKMESDDIQSSKQSISSQNNQTKLLCTINGHDNQQRTIEGICIDTKCDAKQRIWCVACLKYCHSKCSRECLLLKEEFTVQLDLVRQKLQMQQEEQSVLFKLKLLVMSQLEELEGIFRCIGYNKIQSQINRISEILDTPYTQAIWMEAYKLMNTKNRINNDQNLIMKAIQDINNSLNSLVKYLNFDNTNMIICKDHFNIEITAPIQSLDCSPIQDQFVCAIGNTMMIIDINSRNQIGESLKGHQDDIRTVKYSPCGLFIVSGSGNSRQYQDYSIRIWDSTKQSKDLKGHTNAVTQVNFSPDSKNIVSSSLDQTIRIWNCKSCQQEGNPIIPSQGFICSVEYSQDGQQIISAGTESSIKFWDVITRNIIREVNANTSFIRQVKQTKDEQQLISGSWTGSINIWTKDQEKIILASHEDEINAISISPGQNLFLSASKDKTIRIWKRDSIQTIGIIHHSDSVSTACFSRTGEYIISASLNKTLTITPLNIIHILRGMII